MARTRDQIRLLYKQLEAREQEAREERRRADDMQELAARKDAALEAAGKRENAARRENFRLKLRLDAVLYALTLVQLEVRAEVEKEGKPVKDELFLAVGQEPPGRERVTYGHIPSTKQSAEAALRGSGFEFVDGEWRLVGERPFPPPGSKAAESWGPRGRRLG